MFIPLLEPYVRHFFVEGINRFPGDRIAAAAMEFLPSVDSTTFYSTFYIPEP